LNESNLPSFFFRKKTSACVRAKAQGDCHQSQEATEGNEDATTIEKEVDASQPSRTIQSPGPYQARPTPARTFPRRRRRSFPKKNGQRGRALQNNTIAVVFPQKRTKGSEPGKISGYGLTF
jgi:hypothetical protein